MPHLAATSADRGVGERGYIKSAWCPTDNLGMNKFKLLWWMRKRPEGHLRLVGRNLLYAAGSIKPREAYVQAGVDWLLRSQAPEGGLRGWYDMLNGWGATYPEVSGYAVPTLTRIGRVLEARRVLDWLVGLQFEDGAFPGGLTGDSEQRRSVFNTGQILQGLADGWRVFREERYLEAGHRAAQWLTRVQDADGAWRQFSYNQIPHTYYARVAWILADFDAAYQESAVSFGDWAMRQQDADGWFNCMEMIPGTPASLHAIAYTLEGMWRLGGMIGVSRFRESVVPFAEKLMHHMETHSLAGEYDRGYRRARGYICLTGLAQTCIVWIAAYGYTRDLRYLNVAIKGLDYICSVLDLDNPCPDLRGGLPGSYPLTGDYMPLRIINWGTKFFLDALLDEKECLSSASRNQPLHRSHSSGSPSSKNAVCELTPL